MMYARMHEGINLMFYKDYIVMINTQNYSVIM